MPEGKESINAAEAENAQEQADANSAPAANSKLAEYESDLKRLMAEFENYKKRTERERGELLLRGRLEGISEFLTLADELDSAANHAKASSAEQLAKGISLLNSKFHGVLKSSKIEEIKCEGAANPLLHDVLLMQEGGEEGKIAAVLRKGYKCGDYVLRHAQVAVYSGVKNESVNGAKDEESKKLGEKSEGKK